MKKILVLAAAALLAASCIKGDPFICRSLVMGHFEDADLITDGGLVFHVVKSQVNFAEEPDVRVVAVCDVMKQTGSSEKEYDVKLLDYTVPLHKDALDASGVEDWDKLGNDPVQPVELWFSGGHFNMRVAYFFLSSTETVHTLNLVFDDAVSTSDSLFFSLRHNAFGETLGLPDVDMNDLARGEVYATFPIADYFPEGAESVAVKLEYPWYEETVTGENTRTYYATGTFYKEELL